MIDALLTLLFACTGRLFLVVAGCLIATHHTGLGEWGWYFLGAVLSEFLCRLCADRFLTRPR